MRLDAITWHRDRVETTFPAKPMTGSIFPDDAADLLAAVPAPREWLLGNQLCRRFVTVVAAAGGCGKTSLMIGWGLSLATGRKLVGLHVHKRARVLLLSFEDGRDEIQRRLLAACLHHDISPEDLRGWLFVKTVATSEMVLTRAQEGGGLKETGAAEDILAMAGECGVDVVMADPFIKFSGAPENDNGSVDYVCQVLTGIAQTADVALAVAHHTRKGTSTPGEMDNARGASALVDAARIGLTLTPMSQAEAATFDVREHERRRHVRLDDGKTNLAPADQAKWFRLASVSLGNGTEDYPAGDNVQAVETWTPPDTWEGLSRDLVNRILDAIDKGMPNGERYSGASSAKKRAAWRVVKEFAPDKTEKQCRQIVRTWVRTGLLLVEEYESPNERKAFEGLTVDPETRPAQGAQ